MNKFEPLDFLFSLVIFINSEFSTVSSRFWVSRIIPQLNFQKFGVVTQSFLTVCDPVDCGLPGSSVHGIFQERTLEWITISSFRRSSTRDWTPVSCVSCTASRLSAEPSEKPFYLLAYKNSLEPWKRAGEMERNILT